MLQDRYGNTLTTASTAARDAYVEGMDRFLSSAPQVEEAYQQALAADPNFALAHLGIARNRQANGNGGGAREALGLARASTENLSPREQGHLNMLGLLIDGKGAEAYAAARAHLVEHPRDALVAQTCLGVFGLIGFSGRPGREAENLALADYPRPSLRRRLVVPLRVCLRADGSRSAWTGRAQYRTLNGIASPQCQRRALPRPPLL